MEPVGRRAQVSPEPDYEAQGQSFLKFSENDSGYLRICGFSSSISSKCRELQQPRTTKPPSNSTTWPAQQNGRISKQFLTIFWGGSLWQSFKSSRGSPSEGHNPPRGSPRKSASQRALRGSLRGLCGVSPRVLRGLCGVLRGSAGFSPAVPAWGIDNPGLG